LFFIIMHISIIILLLQWCCAFCTQKIRENYIVTRMFENFEQTKFWFLKVI